jgi:hypothetical protein
MQLLSTAAINGGDYNYVSLHGPLGKYNLMVHRLIAIAFIPNPECKEQVNHKDGNKRHNYLSNLEWTTQFENMQHAVTNGLAPRGESSYLAKVTEADVLAIRISAAKGESLKDLAEIYGLDRGTISAMLLGNTWKHVGGPLKDRVVVIKLTPADIPKIRQMFVEGKTNTEIGLVFNVARGNIQQIRSGNNWSNY